jgi:hypothetical protein
VVGADELGPYSTYNPAGLAPKNANDLIIHGVGWGRDISGHDILICPTLKRAEEAQREIDDFLKKIRAEKELRPGSDAMREMFRTIKVSRSGPTVTITGQIPLEAVPVFAKEGHMW